MTSAGAADTTTDEGAPEFDPFSEVFFNDPYPTYKRLRDEAPVYYNDTYGFYALTRHEDVAEAYKNHEVFSSSRGVDLSMIKGDAPIPPLIIMMDPPDHNRMRILVSRVFTPRAVGALEPMVREVITTFFDRADDKQFDVVHDFSALFPVEIITRMLGVPEEHRQNIRIWLDKSLHREPGQIGISEEGMAAAIESGIVYYNLILEKRNNPGDDMISRLIAAEIPKPDGTTTSLDDVEIAGFASLLGGAGAETVTKLIGNAAVLFADNPGEWQKVLDDPDRIPAAVEEILRYHPPAQYVGRYTLKDITLHGVTIPAGSAVLLMNGSASRDERVYDEPDRFNIDREQGQNIGFGYGVHSCLGAALARMESRIALEQMRERMPRYEIDRAGLKRVNMTNVAGFSHVPVTVL
ncbi:MAG: cytochrome [Frankiales bacterium]|nr:cytochrome [Frankiales bacterium]